MNIFGNFWEWPYRIIAIYCFATVVWWILCPIKSETARTTQQTLGGKQSIFHRAKILINGLLWLGKIADSIDDFLMRCWMGITSLATTCAQSISLFDHLLAFGWRLPAILANKITRLVQNYKEEPHEPSASV